MFPMTYTYSIYIWF